MYLDRYPSVNPSKPWENDFLNRREFAETIKELIYKTSSGLTILIRSPFGTGKSYFAKNMHAELFQQNKYVIYIDAFEKEYMIEPILIFMESIYNIFSNLDNKKENKIQNVIRRIKEINLNVSLNFGGLASISFEKDKEDLYIEDILKHTQKVNDLKECIKNISDFMTENKDKLIIIIDELDRCSPDFSLKLIEQLKLFFNYKNITFIILTDDKIIDSIAKIKYGNFFDYNYLEKYIDLDINLPIADHELYINNLLNYLDNIIPDNKNKKIIFTLNNSLIKNLLKKINLRQINDIVNTMYIFPENEKQKGFIYRSPKINERKEFIYRFLLLSLLIFKMMHRDNFFQKDWEYFMDKIEDKNDIHYKLLHCLLHPFNCRKYQEEEYNKILYDLKTDFFDLENVTKLVNRIHSLVSSMNIPS